MAIVEADYLHKLIPPQSAKGDWYLREKGQSVMVVLGTIAGEYKYYLWRLQAFNGLVYFLGDELCYTPIFLLDWCCRYTDPANPGCATLRGKFAMIHLQLHNVAEKLKTPGMHRVNV